MADEATTHGEEQQDDAAALAAAMAGYEGKTRGEQPPVEPAEQPPADEPIQAEASPSEDLSPPEPSEAEKLAAELAGLKAQVASIAASADPHEVRKLHGEIGNINRTLQQLQQAPKDGAVSEQEADDLAQAIKEAERLADEYDEFGKPLLLLANAVKKSLTNKPESQAADINAIVTEKVNQVRRQEAIEALMEEHPDYQTVRETPEFKAWLAGKTPEYQQRLQSAWNPAVVARGLTEFKDSLARQAKEAERKQNRLAAAVTPQGVAQPARPSVLPDEEGLMIGYSRGPKRLSMR